MKNKKLLEVPCLMYKRAVWKKCSYFLPSDNEFRTIGSKTVITGYSIIDKKDHYELSNVPELNSFGSEEKLTIMSAQDSTLQGGSSSGHIKYNKNDLNYNYVKKLKIIFINIMYGKKTINRY